MAGEVGLSQAEAGKQFAHRPFLFQEVAQDHQPVPAGEGAKERLSLGRAGFHFGGVHEGASVYFILDAYRI